MGSNVVMFYSILQLVKNGLIVNTKERGLSIMGFFSKLFGRDTKSTDKELVIEENKDSGYEDIPGFIETDPGEYELVSVIASAVAAGDNPDSSFEIKKILKRNPEVTLVSTIALAVAAGGNLDSQFTINKIQTKKGEARGRNSTC